jgi:stage II sporulation protein D
MITLEATTATFARAVGPRTLMSLFRPVIPATVLGVLAATAPAAHGATELSIRGAGFGHGVGMSQYGALGFAQKGHDHRHILRHYYTGTTLGRLSSNPTVRVLLQSRGSVTFAGAAQAGNRRLNPRTTYRAGAAGGSVVLRTSSGQRIGTFAAPLRAIGPDRRPVRVIGGGNSGTYRGALELRPASGGLMAVNAVGLEDYIRGVVAAESPPSWPAEALKAQAIAARTYAITTTKGGSGWDHYADTRSQVYRGVAAETRTTDAAIAATNGHVVTHEGRPVTTYFFSTSGGKTENSEFGFGGSPLAWLKSVDDPFDNVSPRHRWNRRLTLSQAGSRLGGLVKGRLRTIQVNQRGRSPRVVRATIVGTQGRTTVTGAQLRARLGLYDTWAHFSVIATDARRASAGGSARTAADRGGTVSGRLTGVRSGTVLHIQRRGGNGRWSTAARTRVRKGGSYRAAVARGGVYRVRVNGLEGPVVRMR